MINATSFIPPFIIGVYAVVLLILMFYGLHRYWIVFLYWKFSKNEKKSDLLHSPLASYPKVTVQLPLFNERYVAERLIDTVCSLDYPHENLEIQVLDDSTDETVSLVASYVAEKKEKGFDIHHIRRENRSGYKAGALGYGLKKAKGEFIAIFDADFMPPPSFLKATLPHFKDPKIGMVQTRWGHINANYSMLTRLQALFLDGHFLLEHTARFKSGAFFNFNGTAGIWRKQAIVSAGGWSSRTLTEDLDLSYRAQLAGWNFYYDPTFVCPAELPVDIYAFLSQQRRWTKGALQVAKYVLKDLWKSKFSFHAKLEATIHLTGNIGYLLTVLVVLLLPPSLHFRQEVNWSLNYFELLVFIATTVSITFFYAVSQRELYPNWRWKLKDIPALLSFGIGICVNNARAVIEGLVGGQSEFIRTPKYNIRSRGDEWIKKIYEKPECQGWLIYLVFAVYSGFTLGLAAYDGQWMAIPLILMFVFGFSYVTGLCLIHRLACE